MKPLVSGICAVILLLYFAPASADRNDGVVDELLSLLSKGECGPSSLTRGVWTINTPPLGTHGELVLGDYLVFEQIDDGGTAARRAEFRLWRNGEVWESVNGWTGSCVRDGRLSVYVVRGEILLDGCLHELAIGRLDHDDSLDNRIEIVFRDTDESIADQCGHSGPRHPGHAHGVG
ncbi:MAG: hypothetical protein KJO33_05440 [Gammaproteobacteria bacterium]|nr:hypothetical protein [Gammaproteobacteria bacterium]